METQDDFEPKAPYEGNFYTSADFGVLGRSLETHVYWALNNNDAIMITRIEFCLSKGDSGIGHWIDLADLYLKSPKSLLEKYKDHDLLYEAEKDFERANGHYRAEGGKRTLRLA